jgi:hypothetical protein
MAHENERLHAGRRQGKLFFSHIIMFENYVGKFVRVIGFNGYSICAGSGSGSSFYDYKM